MIAGDPAKLLVGGVRARDGEEGVGLVAQRRR
jgi:hypothetical protein